MKKILIWTFMLILALSLAGCGVKPPAIGKKTSAAAKETSGNNGIPTDINSFPSIAKGDEFILPDSYPKEALPLAADAKLLDVREDPANKGLEVMYLSNNDIDALCDFYEGVLKDAKDLSTQETPDGYMISAKMDGAGYTIMLSKDAMNSNPKYAGKISVYIIVNGLEGISGGSQMSKSEGEPWPSSALAGVPQLKGQISQILQEAGIIRIEMIVENAKKVKGYIKELTAAGFSFDTQPDTESDHIEFLAFKDSSMLSFTYKGEENLVFIEYQK